MEAPPRLPAACPATSESSSSVFRVKTTLNHASYIQTATFNLLHCSLFMNFIFASLRSVAVRCASFLLHQNLFSSSVLHGHFSGQMLFFHKLRKSEPFQNISIHFITYPSSHNNSALHILIPHYEKKVNRYFPLTPQVPVAAITPYYNSSPHLNLDSRQCISSSLYKITKCLQFLLTLIFRSCKTHSSLKQVTNYLNKLTTSMVYHSPQFAPRRQLLSFPLHWLSVVHAFNFHFSFVVHLSTLSYWTF